MENDIYKNRVLIQFLKFCTVGLVNTAIDFLFYFILTRYLGLSGHMIYVAKGLSFLAATINSFFLNSLWTFEEAKSFEIARFLKFYGIIGSGLLVSVGVHFVNVHTFHINDLISVLISAALTAIWGFVLSKKLIFI